MWKDTTRLIADYPIFGCGFGAFESCYQRYQTGAIFSTIDYAHNDYLQVMAELGLLAFVVGLVFVGRIVQRAERVVRQDAGAGAMVVCDVEFARVARALGRGFVDETKKLRAQFGLESLGPTDAVEPVPQFLQGLMRIVRG